MTCPRAPALFSMLFISLSSCGDDKGADSGGADAVAAWQGGELRFYTTAATDACLGGAMEALFMPEGPGTPHAFEFPILAPGYDDLPASYDIDLRAPFLGMPVTVSQGDAGTLVFDGSVMESVELGPSQYGDCTVTMTVGATLEPTGATSLVGDARIDISDARGQDERCPVFAADPCRVTLSISASE